MRNKMPYTLSILADAVFCIAPLVMLIFEQERAEAISGGLIIGSVAGSVLGIIAMILNKDKRKLVYILSVIPMLPLAMFIMMAMPYLLFKQ